MTDIHSNDHSLGQDIIKKCCRHNNAYILPECIVGCMYCPSCNDYTVKIINVFNNLLEDIRLTLEQMRTERRELK